jgi:hypothetical protein
MWVPDAPPVGEAYYYLVRTQAGGTHGTYESTTDPLPWEWRDAEVQAGGSDRS